MSTRDVFVQSIANGQPVAGALVEVWGRNGMIIASQATDATVRVTVNTFGDVAVRHAASYCVSEDAGNQ